MQKSLVHKGKGSLLMYLKWLSRQMRTNQHRSIDDGDSNRLTLLALVPLRGKLGKWGMTHAATQMPLNKHDTSTAIMLMAVNHHL